MRAFEVKKIGTDVLSEWLLNRHYLKRRVCGSKTLAHGIFVNDTLVGGILWAHPRYTKLHGVFGEDRNPFTYWEVLLLSRFYLEDNRLIASQCLSEAIGRKTKCRKRGWRLQEDWCATHPPIFKDKPFVPRLILSYSDLTAGHTGIIYKASGFDFLMNAKSDPLKTIWRLEMPHNAKAFGIGLEARKKFLKKGIVYCATFPNGKKYIGKTIQSLGMRVSQHLSRARKGYQSKVNKAIRKYGTENIVWTVLKDDCEDTLSVEMDFINTLNTTNHTNGYNQNFGGSGNFMACSEETKKKISAANIKVFNNPEMRAAMKKRADDFWAVPGNIERHAKICGATKVYGFKDGNLIGEWCSINRAASELGISRGNLNACVNGKRKSVGGYIFSHKNISPSWNPTQRIDGKIFSVFLKNQKIGEWTNKALCARQLKINPSHISACLNLRPKRSTAGGYGFKYNASKP